METCKDCGKPGIKHMKKHLRYCPGKKGKKAEKPNTPRAAKPEDTRPAKLADEASDGVKFAALLRKKAEDHRATARKLDDMAKAAESLL